MWVHLLTDHRSETAQNSAFPRVTVGKLTASRSPLLLSNQAYDPVEFHEIVEKRFPPMGARV